MIVRPTVFLLLGLNIRRRALLPKSGPAILVANHNSHFDTLVLMTLLPITTLQKIKPIGSADYFFKKPLLRWFAKDILGVIPIKNGTGLPRADVIRPVVNALDKGNIVIIYPEGTRGRPEELSRFHHGIATLARLRPDVPVVPVYLRGLGNVLPKGSSVPVPFNCDVVVAPAMHGSNNEPSFMERLEDRFRHLNDEVRYGVI
jgi:1-acyl-sn-glycerol-3-phosphate acyltransferase